MKLKCRIAGHGAAEEVVYNNGFFFGRCGDCRGDLIRPGGGDGQDGPGGHGGGWKSGSRHSHSLAADFTGLLPVAVDAANLPATQDRFFSWSRALVAMAPRRWRRARAAAATAPAVPDEAEERPYPTLLVAALLVGASLRLLVRLGRP